jgi:hypothetical protein
MLSEVEKASSAGEAVWVHAAIIRRAIADVQGTSGAAAEGAETHRQRRLPRV